VNVEIHNDCLPIVLFISVLNQLINSEGTSNNSREYYLVQVINVTPIQSLC